jgi:phage repressor protein C with HTH and peptisase S24 domain
MPGDYVLVCRYIFKKPKNGDVIVFKHEGRYLIKRIEKMVKSAYFVVGDNKKRSLSSKDFGLVKYDKIIGKVVLKVK